MLDNTSTTPLYIQLKDSIKHDITKGNLPPGTRLLPTIPLAEKYGVCHKTAQMALRALAAEGLVTRRRSHGTIVADLGNSVLSQSVGQKRIALLMRYTTTDFTGNYYMRDIIDGVMHAAQDHECEVDFGVFRSFKSFALDPTLSGFILVDSSREEALRVKQLGLPIILLNNSLARTGLGFVKTDNAYGILLAVRHLVKLGHRRILYVSIDCSDSPSGNERLEGFHAACVRYGLPWAGYVVPNDELDERLLKRDYTAVVADGYRSTVKTLHTFQELGISYPDEISFVGFDEVEFAAHFAKPVTVVRQKLKEVGGKALELILDTDAWRASRIQIKPELIIRNSTRPAT